MGDAAVVRPLSAGLLVGVVDGLGHGLEAELAAARAVEALTVAPEPSVVSLVLRCHERMRGTRGGVLAVAFLDALVHRLTWAGVGNVEGLVWRGTSTRPLETLLSRGGIVGYGLPAVVRDASLAIEPGDTLVLATDGLRSSVRDTPPRGDPAEAAAALLDEHARDTDDALVLVVRYLGGEAG
jgi:negative regulator of sigma-B (phosphoserine phosphatase)